VILAENDPIVPVTKVESYLAAANHPSVRTVLKLPNQTHGGFLVDDAAQELVLRVVRDAQEWGATARGGAAPRGTSARAAPTWRRRLRFWRRDTTPVGPPGPPAVATSTSSGSDALAIQPRISWWRRFGRLLPWRRSLATSGVAVQPGRREMEVA
jgi:hypothetical protein